MTAIMFFILSFTSEFKRITVGEPPVKFEEELTNIANINNTEAWQGYTGIYEESDSAEDVEYIERSRTDEYSECEKRTESNTAVSEVRIDNCNSCEIISEKVTLTARSPGKLFSLSMSLLLAAFLQAVRCLTTFIDDTLKNI